MFDFLLFSFGHSGSVLPFCSGPAKSQSFR
jgi:hypothetical protein